MSGCLLAVLASRTLLVVGLLLACLALDPLLLRPAVSFSLPLASHLPVSPLSRTLSHSVALSRTWSHSVHLVHPVHSVPLSISVSLSISISPPHPPLGPFTNPRRSIL